MRADGGIARGIYVTAAGRRVVVQHVFAKKAARSTRDRQGEDETGDDMTELRDLKARLMEDPEFREEYVRVDEEYALIEALVRARAAAIFRGVIPFWGAMLVCTALLILFPKIALLLPETMIR